MAVTMVPVRFNMDVEAFGGGQRMLLADIQFDSSYPTGGEALNPADLGLEVIEAVVAVGSGGGYLFDYIPASKKLLVFRSDYPAVSAGPLVEVPNATDLSALKPTCLVIGR